MPRSLARILELLLVCGLTLSAAAQSFTAFDLFDGPNGVLPNSSLVQTANGTLVGSTYGGGSQNRGVLYHVTRSGKLDRFYSFCNQTDCPDGGFPNGLVLATDGEFYGTTQIGGTNEAGTIFKISPSEGLTTLVSFDYMNGENPFSGVMQANNGAFYGTTGFGGTHSDGTVFKFTANGKLMTLYNFGGNDGNRPTVAPIEGADGSLYGTTSEGGLYGWGTIFTIDPTGMLTTLHSFCAVRSNQGYCADGAYPTQLIQASDGNIYGTTWYGGTEDCYNTNAGCGTIFRITLTGVFSSVYDFCATKTDQGYCADGSLPGGLIQATDGNLYGVTGEGGTGQGGTIFKVTPKGVLTTLYNFCSQANCSDGAVPFYALLQSTDGSFYGTTQYGNINGTAFRLSMGLAPFVKALPTAAKVGNTVGILGTDLIGATSVTFNGVTASFKVVSASLIKTTVPAGATTGPIQVTLPNGVLQSNVPFVVIQ